MRSCIKNGVLSKLPIDSSRPIPGGFVDQDCEYHQCKGHSANDCFKLRHDIQNLIDSGKITKPSERSKPSTRNNPLPQYQFNYPSHKSQTGGLVNAIGSGLPEELVLAEAELEERMCAMLNIWNDCNSEEEVERKPVKVEIEKSITIKIGEIPDNEDEQSLTRSGRVYNLDSNSLVRGKGIVIDGTEKKISEKGEEQLKEKKKEVEADKAQKKVTEIGESS
ncbi:hypothetical protein JCGZ_03540 [Jatropha curcas]|uniref:Uncharacterized protein n=1 Tax=Jatropha curcas TaxID=180498 RepID=A0A067JDH1_JATCU|nr:hypothetical protein JCGZ_03540 [Jatropha curcas]